MPALTRKQTILVLSGVAAFLLFCLVVIRAFTGGAIGEDCAGSGYCRFGLICLNDRCLPPCQDDDDCPENMRCGIVMPRTPLNETRDPLLVCLEKKEAERSVQRSVSARGEKSLTVLNQKRSDTYDAVQKLLIVEKWTLTDEQFDEKWNALPEDVRWERPVKELARIIMTTGGTPAM